MKLVKILEQLNSLEKNSFIKIIDGIINNNPENAVEIAQVLESTDKTGLKNADNLAISSLFSLVQKEFTKQVKAEFVNAESQLDILIDIIIRDGNCIMKLDWFSRLYEKELSNINEKVLALKADLENPKSEIDEQRKRDYDIYLACIKTAYNNDAINNRDLKITDDELSILLTLSQQLELSQEETKLINYMCVPIRRLSIDEVVNELKNLGLVFYAKKTNTIYVADEMVRLLRKVREKEIADKYFRRTLNTLKEPLINLVCKKHNINRKLPLDEKIKKIINEGISFRSLLSKALHKEGTNLSDKKKFINELFEKNLGITSSLKGSTVDEKIDSFIEYFETIEKDDRVEISMDGYEHLLIDLKQSMPEINALLKNEFELQEENVLSANYLIDYNIKPRDIIDLIPAQEITKFCTEKNIKQRGNTIDNILDAYKDSENLLLENYDNIARRDLNKLKENNIRIKEADLGIKFEELTKNIFKELGFFVDEKLKAGLNTKNDKIDILLNLGNNEVILIECKTIKESGYNKFSSVSRQMKAYRDLVKSNGYSVVKSLLIAPEFSDEFINETELEYELNLSLITSSSLMKIIEGFKQIKKHKVLPYKLLMRDVVIQEDRVLKALEL